LGDGAGAFQALSQITCCAGDGSDAGLGMVELRDMLIVTAAITAGQRVTCTPVHWR
jgi:hypothetical protein